jgi:hypothetical protein
MSTEAKGWEAARFREIHVGHFHKRKEVLFKTGDEFAQVRYRVIPSLTPPDAWHKQKGYAAVRAAEAFVLGRETGVVANFSYSPRNSQNEKEVDRGGRVG